MRGFEVEYRPWQEGRTMALGPMKGLEFAHNAIVATTADIEQVVLAARTPEVATELRPRVQFLARFIHGHVRGEEHAMYPPLAAKVPHIEKTFLVDHRDEEQVYADLEGLTSRCAEAGTAASFDELRRRVSVLRAISDLHVKKENEIVLPLIGEHFDTQEQAAMIGGILSVIPAADMPRFVPWITACQTPELAVAYVGILAKNMPATAFAAAKGWIRDGVPHERWALLVQRVPELAS